MHVGLFCRSLFIHLALYSHLLSHPRPGLSPPGLDINCICVKYVGFFCRSLFKYVGLFCSSLFIHV